MKNQAVSFITLFFVMTLLLSLTGGLACAATMTPELAAKRENYRKQQAQRITPEKRKAAAEALKAERVRLYNARQAAQQSTPVPSDKK